MYDRTGSYSGTRQLQFGIKVLSTFVISHVLLSYMYSSLGVSNFLMPFYDDMCDHVFQ